MTFRRKIGIAALVGVSLVVLCAFAARALVRSAYRANCVGLHAGLIGTALDHYQQIHGTLPPAYVLGEDGKPAHSWRVLILPFLGERDLYSRYDFNEPWDGPHNRLLADEMPDIYRCPASGRNGPYTNFVAVVGPRTPWPGAATVSRKEIKNRSATLLVVEVADSKINWMEPRDLTLAEASVGVNKDRQRGISSNHEGGTMGVDAYFYGVFLPENTPPDVFRARLTIEGGELLTDYGDGLVLKKTSAEAEHKADDQ